MQLWVWNQNGDGISILIIFQDRPMFSHTIQKVSARASHWCGRTHVYIEKLHQNTLYPRFSFIPKTGIAFPFPKTGLLFLMCSLLVHAIRQLEKQSPTVKWCYQKRWCNNVPKLSNFDGFRLMKVSSKVLRNGTKYNITAQKHRSKPTVSLSQFHFSQTMDHPKHQKTYVLSPPWSAVP